MAETSKYTIDGYQKLIGKERENAFFEVVDQLMDEVKTAYQENGKLSDEILAVLSCVFQSTLIPALDLVDNKSVTMVTCPSGRNLFQCKHALAARLSQAMGICKTLEVSDQELANMISQID